MKGRHASNGQHAANMGSVSNMGVIYLYDHSSSDKEIVGRGAGERPAVENMC